MSEVLQANIFFFITGIAVIVFTMLLCIVLYHLIKILKSIRRVVDRIEIGSEIIADDMMHFRKYFAESGFIASLISAFFGRRGPAARRQTSSSRRKTHKRPLKKELTITDED